MLWVLVAHAEYVCFSLSPVLCWRRYRRPNFPPVKMRAGNTCMHTGTHTHMNTDLLTLVLSDISCCQSGQCCEILLATVFLGITPTSHPQQAWCYIVRPCLIVATIAAFDTVCVARTALFNLGKSVVVFLSGRPTRLTDTNETWWPRSDPLPHLPSIPSALPERQKNPFVLNSQTQPGNQIGIHRISPCLF